MKWILLGALLGLIFFVGIGEMTNAFPNDMKGCWNVPSVERCNPFNENKNITFDDCKYLSFDDTAYCLRDYISPFFIFRETNEDLSFEELKELGGDCENWSLLYQQMLMDLGYDSKLIQIDMGIAKHQLTVLYGPEGYCMLDQLKVNCVKYERGELE